jgi:hypothetical protein
MKIDYYFETIEKCDDVVLLFQIFFEAEIRNPVMLKFDSHPLAYYCSEIVCVILNAFVLVSFKISIEACVKVERYYLGVVTITVTSD